MIIDVTGTILLPGNGGRDCPGNGEDPNVEGCCDECDYLLCCLGIEGFDSCDTCKDKNCHRPGRGW